LYAHINNNKKIKAVYRTVYIRLRFKPKPRKTKCRRYD
jgi:hypothetical protein